MKSVEINVTLQQKAERFIELNARKVLCILVKELTTTGVFIVYSKEDVEKLELTTENKSFIKRGLGQKTIIIAATTIENALTSAKVQKYNMLCSYFNGEGESIKVVDFVKSQVNDYKNNIMSVLANAVKPDFENIINFTTKDIKVGSATFTAEQYTSRIANVIVNIPTTESATYHVLPEVDTVPLLTQEELNTKVSNGELVLRYDGEKVKIERGVTSLTTLTGKTEDMQSIRLVTTGNIIKNDIQKSVADKYVGKLIGTYNNKMNICTEIKSYFKILSDPNQGIIGEEYQVDLDVASIKKYIESLGQSTETMSENEIRHFNTKRKCFIRCVVSLLDSMEDFYITIEA